MGQNGESGKVIEKNIPIISDTLDAGQLTAVKHANGTDWWIFSPQYASKRYYYFLMTADSLQGPFEQQVGGSSSYEGQGGGQATFSPDGTKYARYTPQDDLFLFDFDRSTGQLSNFQFVPIVDSAFTGGLAFSPDSRFLYVSSQHNIYQFDMEASDIEASKVVVAQYDGFRSPSLPTTFYLAQLGPDCKIYINTANSVDHLHVIHQPDKKGLACQIEQHAIEMPARNFATMPYFPNYRLGPAGDEGWPCDSTLTTAVGEVPLPEVKGALRVWPNPASTELSVSIPDGVKSEAILIYDARGNLIKMLPITERNKAIRIAVSDLNVGIYLLRLSGDEFLLARFVIIR